MTTALQFASLPDGTNYTPQMLLNAPAEPSHYDKF